jgi:hypothetical protein
MRDGQHHVVISMLCAASLLGCPSAEDGVQAGTVAESAAEQSVGDGAGRSAPGERPEGPAQNGAHPAPHAVVHVGVTCVTYEAEPSDRTIVVSESHGAALTSVEVTCALASEDRPRPMIESLRMPLGEVELSVSEPSVENVGAHVLDVSGETWLSVNYRRLDATNTTFTVETAFANPWSTHAP